MNEELLRHVDSIHRDKGVDKDTIYAAIEEALAAAARKRYKTEDELEVKIDRTTGEISAIQDGEVLPLDGFGGKVKYAQLLNDASEVSMVEGSTHAPWDAATQDPRNTLTLQLPVTKPEAVVPVVELFMK